MPVILFVCTANRFRSPIAAAFTGRKILQSGIPGDWTVVSAGTWTENGLPAHPKAISISAGLGLDLINHHSRVVNTALVSAADLIIVMEPGHKEALEIEFPSSRGKIMLLGELADENNSTIADPSEANFEECNATARTIVDSIETGFTETIRRAVILSANRRSRQA
jgi:protein arginine phosphatase